MPNGPRRRNAKALHVARAGHEHRVEVLALPAGVRYPRARVGRSLDGPHAAPELELGSRRGQDALQETRRPVRYRVVLPPGGRSLIRVREREARAAIEVDAR